MLEKQISFTKKKLFNKLIVRGLITGIIAAVLNNAYAIIYMEVTNFLPPTEINALSISMATFLAAILATFVYFGLTVYSSYPNIAYIVGGIFFLGVSLLAPMSKTLPDGTFTPEGFAGLAVPMHIISGLLILLIIPYFKDFKQPDKNK